MNSRERVARTTQFQQPDRVPIDLGGMKASGIAAVAFDRVRKRLGIQGLTRVQDPRFMIAAVDQDFLSRFHLDVVPLDLSTVHSLAGCDQDWVQKELFDGTDVLMPPGTRIAEEANGDWVLLDTDGAPTTFRMPRNGFYFDDMAFNTGRGIRPEEFNPPTSLPEETLELLAKYGRHLYRDTEYALLGWGGGVCFLGLSLITDRKANVTMGMPSEWMVMLMTEKETCHEMMDRAVEASISCFRLLYQAIGDCCFAWGIASDDSGTQRGEFINPDLWEEMIKPHYRRLCEWVHKNTRWKTFLHCCGSIYHLIPHFIDAGIDILNPVQTSAANMDPARLKAEFGKRLVFWGGGCDTQSVLSRATPEEVREHVKERLGIFAPGGGFVFNQVHNVQANVPAENIIAMLEAAYEFGRYEEVSP
jgi:uroporphyrinogen-III decarboxylase